MKKRIVWLMVSCLMVAALLLASCGPAAEEEEVVIPGEEEEVVPVEEEEVAPGPEEPKYGGVLNISRSTDVQGFDEATTPHFLAPTLNLTNEELLTGDWAKGPAGTDEADLIFGGVNRMDLKTGSLAESWEIPEAGTMIFHIRKGVHYALDPDSEASRLVNGREVTADDVVFSFNRYIDPDGRSYIRLAYPRLAASTTITAPDEWTVVIKCPPEEFGDGITQYPDQAMIMPREVIEEYGDMKDWRNSVGTGPFMLTEFVPGSVVSLKRNPNYWMKDPCGPGKGNQLPYMDGIKWLIIPDASTRIAALRTAKIDRYGATWEDAADIMATNPELIYKRYLGSDSCMNIFMRQDDPETPFADIRVRQALMLAIDQPAIKEDYYVGDAEILVWPITPSREYADAYVPLEELPESVRELYEYHPDKAKQLLAEAGYPDGFKTSILCYQQATTIDQLSTVKAYWEEIGVELELDTREYGVWQTLTGARRYKELLYGYNSGIGTYYKMINYNGTSQFNGSYVDDAHVKEVRTAMIEIVGTDEAKVMEMHRELVPYLLEQAWVITWPNPYGYIFWQPWLKNYHGEAQIGYYNGTLYTKYVWLDLDLKEEMTGRR